MGGFQEPVDIRPDIVPSRKQLQELPQDKEHSIAKGPSHFPVGGTLQDGCKVLLPLTHSSSKQGFRTAVHELALMCYAVCQRLQICIEREVLRRAFMYCPADKSAWV